MATTVINVTTTGTINASIGICGGPSGIFLALPDSDPQTLLRMLEYARSEVQREVQMGTITTTPALPTQVS